MALLLLGAVLAMQAWLSMRLIRANTAFLDEATYLFAGQQELAHLTHGAAVETYASYFSGAPVVYPVIAALVNKIGGLAAARLLSLGFMLAATVTLWDTSRRLFGLRAAAFATALFGVLGPTQFLSAFATYDAMALFLMSLSAWCAVAAKDQDDSTPLLLATAACLAAANATKYATGLFDPTVCLLAAFAIADRRGWKAAWGRGGYLAALATGLVSLLLFLGGPYYVTGLLTTTLARRSSDVPPLLVLSDSARWIGLVCLIAVAAAALAMRHPGRPRSWILALLALTAFLAPTDQARIHTLTSLSKHVDFGAWFAAAAAGYLLARLTRAPNRPLRALLAAVVPAAVVAPMLAAGQSQAARFFQEWPNSTRMVAAMRAVTATRPGPYLVEDYDVAAYYLEQRQPWQAWDNTWHFEYRDPATGKNITGPPAYAAAIRDGHFSLIVLDFHDTIAVDNQIKSDIQRFGGYRVIARALYKDRFGNGLYTIWGRTR